MDCLPVCQRGLPKKEGIRYNEHNSNMNEATVNENANPPAMLGRIV